VTDDPGLERRRRAPRVSTSGWSGRYVVEDDPESSWNECNVLDISVLGVGLEAFPTDPGDVSEALIGRRIVVHVQAPTGASVTVRLIGRAKNVTPGRDGGTRVGLEFVDLSETERSILRVMELMKVVW
jgi:PilZ domain